MTAADLKRDAAQLAGFVRPVSGMDGYDELIERAGGAQFVLMGEASHGTHEFYAVRAEITRQLVLRHGCRLVALEADWPDTLRVHRYVTGQSQETDAVGALGDFRRFPSWMWRNTVMVGFVEWLRARNLRATNEGDSTGLFGMDLYSMHTSMESVLAYLDKNDADAARRARQRYGCFEYFGKDPQAYGYITTRGQAESCEAAVTAQLVELRRAYGELMSRGGPDAKDEFFYAEQNARLVANAERYYRAMFHGRDDSWNLRDEHMTETIAALVRHFGESKAKIVVWAHNSHLGDARATEMGRRGEWNVGQLLRQRFPEKVFNIGFTTHAGTVTAARDWGEVAERRRVRSALAGSYEELFHATGIPAFWLDLRERNAATWLLQQHRLERAIGVVYRPETERWSHYFDACLPEQFDAVIHLDATRGLEPLERESIWDEGELPETFPAGV